MATACKNNVLTATAVVLILASTNVFAESNAHSMTAYTTCAVYHRMLAGAYKSQSQSSALADLETEKMNDFIGRAKRAGQQAFGPEAAEPAFLEVWREDIHLMESQINRNYKNIARLRMSYRQQCEALQ
jgi:hypothetical protein